MHLRLIVALLCLSLILVEAGDYGEGGPRSALLRKIYPKPSRVVVIHHHGRRGRGSGKGSSSSSSSSGSGSGSGKKRRYRRSANSSSSSSSEERGGKKNY